MDSFVLTLILLTLSMYLGYLIGRGRVKDINEEVYHELKKKDRETWIAFLDRLKPKSKEEKIKELEEEITELKKE